MKKYRYEFEMDDDFELGYCHSCPLSYEETYDYDGDVEWYTHCSIGCEYENCPLKEIK